METKFQLKDLDIQIKVRSSKMSSKELEKITMLCIETLSQSGALNLIERTVNVTQTCEKILSTVTSTFQSEE